MYKNLEKIITKWIYPLMIILSFFIFDSFNYYFLAFSVVIYIWRNLPLGIVLNLAYLILSLMTDISPITTINLFIITILIFINENSPHMKVISYVFTMAIYINFMSQINFIISIITIIGILIFMYLKERRKIFLFLLVPVIALSFFNENIFLYDSIDIEQVKNEESIREEVIFEEENKNKVENNDKDSSNIKNQSSTLPQKKDDTPTQAPQDLMIYQSLILLIALFVLLWILFYHKMYENRKVFFYFTITIVFIALSIFTILAFDFNELKPYSPASGTGLTQEDIENNFVYRNILQTYKNINNSEDYEDMILKEQELAIKFLETVIRYYLIITIIILLILTFFIIKTKGAKSKKKKPKKVIQKEKRKIYSKKGIYLIDEGYKFIRNNFYFQYSYLTPYELIETVPVSSEFKKLTDLFVQKEYGSKEISVSDEEIKNIIDKIIENLQQ